MGAVKAVLCRDFAGAYASEWEAHETEILAGKSKNHGLQWVFDLQFLRVCLAHQAAPGEEEPSDAEDYRNLVRLVEKLERAILNDPVDRLLYQKVLKSALAQHVEAVRVLLSPFFLFNPQYNYLAASSVGAAEGSSSGSSSKDGGLNIQATFAAPMHQVLPRFPLLPLAISSAYRAQTVSAELDARLGTRQGLDRPGARVGEGTQAGSVAGAVQERFGRAGGLAVSAASSLFGGAQTGAAETASALFGTDAQQSMSRLFGLGASMKGSDNRPTAV